MPRARRVIQSFRNRLYPDIFYNYSILHYTFCIAIKRLFGMASVSPLNRKKGWIMTKDLDREGRLSFLLVDNDTRAALRDFRDILARHIDDVLDAFYAHVRRTPEVARLFGAGTGASVDHARAMQRRHWLDNVFSGEFSDAYFAQVAKIGQIHEQVGLEPRWYIAAYAFTLNRMVALVLEAYRKKPQRAAEIIAAINKAVFLDMDVAISVYDETSKRHQAAALMNAHADAFEQDVTGVLKVVSSAAGELEATARTMAATAEETLRQSTAVASAAEHASANVETVAAATEELTASIQEISRQVSQSTQIASAAVDEARRTNTMVQGLTEAAGKIGEVVKLINDIASQTNLLALNATIEASRAGEAGKGFAVVAGEVKNLANQTGRATDEITAQITAVQSATRDAVTAIQGIGQTIGQISEIASAIAAAVEEQGAATQEIARNVQEAAEGTGTVTRNISLVTSAASETGSAAREVLTASSELSRQSDGLNSRVGSFLGNIRNGD